MAALEVGLVDLPIQLDTARAALAEAGLEQRVRLHPLDLLDPNAALPHGYEIFWMSQLLDCFSEAADRRYPAQGARRPAAGGPLVDPRAVLGPSALRSGRVQPAADLALFRLRGQRQQPDVRLGGVPRPAAPGRPGGDEAERRRRELPHPHRVRAGRRRRRRLCHELGLGSGLDRHPRLQRSGARSAGWPRPRWRCARVSSSSTTARPTAPRSDCTACR